MRIPKSEEEILLELETALLHTSAMAKHFHDTREGHYLLSIVTQLKAQIEGRDPASDPSIADLDVEFQALKISIT